MLPEKLTDYVRKNKAVTVTAAVFLILAVVVIGAIFSWVTGMQSSTQRSAAMYESAYDSLGSQFMTKSSSWSSGTPSAPSAGNSNSYVEVKEGSMTIDTKNAENDASDIRTLVESYKGYVEDMRKYDNDYNLNINLRVRVPEESFQQFVDTLKNRYDEKSFTVSFYRISTQNEVDELDILNSAFNNYEQLRNRTMLIALDENQINLLFKITEKELEIKRLEKQYTSSLSGKQQMSDYATLTVNLQQEKKVSVMPERLGNQLRLKAKNALNDITNSLMDIVTGSVAVFVSAIKSVIYIILIVIPILGGYRILKRVYNWILRAAP